MGLAIIAVIALIALASRSTAPQTKQTPPPDDKSKSGGGSSEADLAIKAGEIAAGLGATVAGAGLVALAVGTELVAGEVGAQITKSLPGDDGTGMVGRVTGYANPIIGTAVNVARVAGNEFDKAAGGQTTDTAIGGKADITTSIVAQAGAGAATGLAIILGGPFALFAGVGLFSIAVLAYAIASAVSDLGRLAYGQKGALEDYRKTFVKVYTRVYSIVRGGGFSDEQAFRYAYPFADGYMQERNRQAFREWMATGRGFLGLGTTSNGEHARFGSDRGYFVGVPTVNGSGLASGPGWLTSEADYLSKVVVPVQDIVTATYEQVSLYDYDTHDAKDESKHYAGSTCQLMLDKGQDDTPLYRQLCMVEVQTPKTIQVTTKGDKALFPISEQGRVLANIESFIEWLAQPRGATLSLTDHIRRGLETGRYEGSLVASGNLVTDKVKPDGSLTRGELILATTPLGNGGTKAVVLSDVDAALAKSKQALESEPEAAPLPSLDAQKTTPTSQTVTGSVAALVVAANKAVTPITSRVKAPLAPPKPVPAIVPTVGAKKYTKSLVMSADQLTILQAVKDLTVNADMIQSATMQPPPATVTLSELSAAAGKALPPTTFGFQPESE